MNPISLAVQRLRSLLLCGLLLSPGLIHAQQVSNPVSEWPDPFITYANGYYYLTGTTGPVVHLRRSQTLNGLKTAPAITVFTPAPGGPEQEGWAPELHFLDGKWYIYYSAFKTSEKGNDSRIYVLENPSADPLAGSWTLKGAIRASPDYWAIDGTVMVLGGQKYLIWAGHELVDSNHSALYIARLSNPWTITGPRARISTPDAQWFDWEKTGMVNEGPEVMQANGKVFLTYSTNSFNTPDYCLGMYTMDNADSDPMNPASWRKSTQPVFKKNDATAIYATGHNSFFKSPDGTEFWLAYHSRSNPGIMDGNRNTSVKKINWASDGTPVFGVPTKNGERMPAPSGEAALPTAAPLANGVYRLISRNSGSVLEVLNGDRTMGATVQQYQWLDGDAQRWYIEATGNNTYSITSLAGGLSLEVLNASKSAGTQVRQWAPNGAPCQQWQIVDAGGGYYKVVNLNSGLVLGVAGGSTANGAQITQQVWSQGTAQQWRFEFLGQTPMRNGVYALFNQSSGQVMDVAGCSAADGARIEQFTWWGGNCQRFNVTANSDGTFRIVPQSSTGKSFDLPSCSSALGSQIQQYQSLDNDCQKWIINGAGSGYYTISSKYSGLVLEVPGCSNVAPTVLQQYTSLNNACQKWHFEPVTPTGP